MPKGMNGTELDTFAVFVLQVHPHNTVHLINTVQQRMNNNRKNNKINKSDVDTVSPFYPSLNISSYRVHLFFKD